MLVYSKRGNKFQREAKVISLSGLSTITSKLISEGVNVYLNCERPDEEKLHQLGDRWGVDRRSATTGGKTVTRFFNDREDIDMVRNALERGCK